MDDILDITVDIRRPRYCQFRWLYGIPAKKGGDALFGNVARAHGMCRPLYIWRLPNDAEFN
jgi:hypothetical protein